MDTIKPYYKSCHDDEDNIVYFSSNNHKLVARNTTGIITCENYVKWYDLYYINNDGGVVGMYDAYPPFNNVEYFDNSWNPYSLAIFALHEGLKIGAQSYKAILMRYCESKERSYLSSRELPSRQMLELLLEEDYGDYSECDFYDYEKHPLFQWYA